MVISMRKIRERIFHIIQIGDKSDLTSRIFDIFIVVVILVNLFTTLFATFDESAPYTSIINQIEFISVMIFTVEFVLRLWTADFLYPDKNRFAAMIAFFISFYGLIDFLTFAPYYLPIGFPAGVVALRVFRVIRIFKLFRINPNYDAFNVIVDVINEKKNQILSSFCMILILMIASSLCMYSLEHEAQPECFQNAFSGIWWSVSTLLTVGYGDIYPITVLGKVMAIVISFLGVGMVAIPTGIISAGFVEQYTKQKNSYVEEEENLLKLVTATVPDSHPWNGKMIKEIVFPPQLLLVALIRDDDEIIPNGNTRIVGDDILVFGAKHYEYEKDINLTEIVIKEESDWIGKQVKDLDISRLQLLVMIQRKTRSIIPNGSTVIKKDDRIVMYTKHKD